jgi:hypothetical protein
MIRVYSIITGKVLSTFKYYLNSSDNSDTRGLETLEIN